MSKKPTDSDEIELWQQATRDVKRLKGKEYQAKLKKPSPSKVSRESSPASTPSQQYQPKPAHPSQQPKNQHIDRRTADRLRKGQIRPEATLDLHGMAQDKAHSALIHFIQSAFAQKKRCVLLITGKGTPRTNHDPSDDLFKSPPGILKKRAPEWLQNPSLNPYLLQFCPAQPKDGGQGALYIYLRKNTD